MSSFSLVRPPVTEIPKFVPPGANGGGIAWLPVGGGEGNIIQVRPGGGGGGAIAVGGPITGAVGSPPIIGGGGAEGGRAIAAVGGALAALLLASAIVWAVYKFKPGLIACGGGAGKGAGAGAGGGALEIGPPKPTSNFPLLVTDGSKLFRHHAFMLYWRI